MSSRTASRHTPAASCRSAAANSSGATGMPASTPHRRYRRELGAAARLTAGDHGFLSSREEPSMARPPFPPFTEETARQKVQAAEDAWNTRDPHRVAQAYTEDTVWRNRSEFV